MADDSKLRTARSASLDRYPDSSARSGSSSGADPLAELARLIGQDDLFERMRRDAARAGHGDAVPSRAAQGTPAWTADDVRDEDPHAHELRGSFEPGTAAPAYAEPGATQGHAAVPRRSYATPRPLEESYDEPSAYAATEHPDYAQQPYPEAAHTASHGYAEGASPAYAGAHAAYDDPAYDPAYDYDHPAYAAGPVAAERRRGGLLAVAAVGGLAVLGTAGALGYWAFSGDGSVGEPPIITANPSPGKVAPAPQSRGGGAADRSRTSGSGERVVPREEQPVELQQARTTAPRMMGQGSLVGSTSQSTAAMVPPTTGAAGAFNPDAPKRVKTIAIRPDGSLAPDSDRTQSIPAPGRAAPAARTAALPPAAAPAPAAGTHVVQVASQRSEQDAQASFRALQAKYPQVLSGREPLIRKIDLGERGVFYRVQVGPFASAEQANDVCGNLKAAGGQCIVQRN